MTFVVRLFFTGLIAFVPSDDGKELTVLIPQAAQAYTASDHSKIEPHQAVLLARAAKCTGDCRNEDPEVAKILFPDKPASTARESLSQALLQGAAWRLDGSELSIQTKDTDRQAMAPLKIHRDLRQSLKGRLQSIPETASEGKDFSWVADLSRIVPSSGTVDPLLLQPTPPAGRIAARLKLRSGEVWTRHLIKVGGEILPLRFQTLDGKVAETEYTQALADLVMVEIQVTAAEFELIASRFEGGKKRTIRLAPENGVLEIALLNLPTSHFNPHSATGSSRDLLEPGKHFELYYELAKNKPVARPVPFPVSSVPATRPPAGYRDEQLGSKLLDGIRFGQSHGIYERILCPLGQLSAGGGSS